MLAAGSATSEDFVSEDGQTWMPIQEWMQQAPREKESEKSTSRKDRRHSRPRRSRYSSHNKKSRFPGEARQASAKVMWMIILLLLAMVGGAVWLYLESEKKQASYNSGLLPDEVGEQVVADGGMDAEAGGVTEMETALPEAGDPASAEEESPE